MPASNCDPATRSINRGVQCGSKADYWYYSPWRAPGEAPVFDACGLAGGYYAPNPTCGYETSPHAKMGAKGSELPPVPPAESEVWAAGSHATVAWAIQANQYVRTRSRSRTHTAAASRRSPLRVAILH